MKKIFREPLLHFLLIGAALFATYSFLNPKASEGSDDEVVVSAGQIKHMTEVFARTWQRPPTREELAGLVDQYVREEILSREAIKLGLNEDDPIIRRRLQQKMEFIADDLASAAAPSEDELAAYLARHPDKFREEATLTLRQVYLNPEKHGEELEATAAKTLASLKASGATADPSMLGDSTLLPGRVEEAPMRRVAGTFGDTFAEALLDLPVGEWAGPVASPFGSHLVFVEKRTEGRVPPLAEIRGIVEREWMNERRIQADAQLMANLRSEYRVTIEDAEPAKETRTP